MTRIILVRHCEAAGNLNRRFQGHTDAEVTENGKKQLELLALRMRNVKIDYLYSSPLKRLMLLPRPSISFIICQFMWRRIDGDQRRLLGGRSLERVFYPVSRGLRLMGEPALEVCTAGRRAMVHVFERMKSCVDRIAGEHPGKTVCIATHGCAIRNFLCSRAESRLRN